jgi:hypothetical protein
MKFSKFSDDDDWTAHHSSGCSRLFLYRLIGGCALSPNFDRLHFDRPGRDGIARSTITTRFWSEGSSVRGEGQEYPLDVMPPPANHERVDSFRPSLVKVLKSYPGHIVKSLLPEVNTGRSQHSRCSANSLVVSLTRITCLYLEDHHRRESGSAAFLAVNDSGGSIAGSSTPPLSPAESYASLCQSTLSPCLTVWASLPFILHCTHTDAMITRGTS